jgi:hypothetical protein
VKVLCSQAVVNSYRCGVVLCQVTAQASAPQGPWFVFCLWLQKGFREDTARSKAVDFYTLSCGSLRKLARNLIETAQRKSHPLEGSRQEAIPLPSTTFDIFSRCVPLGTLHPRLAIADASLFSCPWRRRPCAAPVTHQDQGRVTSRSCARRLPLASRMPQKTFGSLPCPSVYSVQITWLPCGSTFSKAHGRGVAQLSHAVAGPLSEVETGTNQIGWLSTNSSPSLQSQPHCGAAVSQTLSSPHRARGRA